MMPSLAERRPSRWGRLSSLIAFVILITTIAWVSTPVSASAATIDTDVLRLRSGPGTDYTIIARMYEGEDVEILAGPTDGWYKVSYYGTVGWASGDYLDTNSSTGGTDAWIGTDKLRLRSGPSTDYSTIDFMYEGESISVLDGPSGGFYKVSYYGEIGWAYGDYISFDGGGSSTDTGTAYVITDRLRVRSGPSLSNATWDYLNTGDSVYLTGRLENNFYSIDWGGDTAWVYADYISWDQPSTGNKFWVPSNYQDHNLSCEYASLEIATTALGYGIYEDNFINIVGWSANPHYGYRGDIDGAWGGTTDYGVYPEALVDGLAYYGFTGHVFYGGSGTLKSYLDADMPTLVWLDLWYDSSFTATINGEYVTLAPGAHVVVAYGYDGNGVFVSDPARGGKRQIPWSDFLAMWGSMDQMSLAVSY